MKSGPWPFFARRWRGEVPLRTLLWRDMLGVGTLVNVAATLVALVMVSQDGPAWAAVAVHFAPAPYNLFLFAVFQRSSNAPIYARAIAVGWLALVTLA